MKKVIIPVLAISSLLAGTAHAEPADRVQARIDALEKENAAIRRENEVLRQNKVLRERNAALRSTTAPVATAAPASAVRSDPLNAYAADLPFSTKAPVQASPRQFRLWAEGGAIWSGGDPVLSDYTLSPPFIGNNTAGTFNLLPKVGWQAAAGFDYRFAASPWHVSGQIRYGEAEARDSASAVATGTIPRLATISSNDTSARTNKETHWLADAAIGHDIAGNGPDSLQFKFGVRGGEWVGKLSSTGTSSTNAILTPPQTINGILVTQTSQTSVTNIDTRSSFIGIGPRIGIEGAVPLAAGWAFDYLADVAVLFGSQKQVGVFSVVQTFTPANIAANNLSTSTTTPAQDLFSTAISADLQVGVSYWVQPNVKLSASYRIDALTMFNTRQGTANYLPDRYTHGPRLGVAATF